MEHRTIASGDALLCFSAGGAIGCLLGISMGLSASPVVATVLAALGTGLLALLGLKAPSGQDSGGSFTRINALSVLGFGVVSVVSLLVGLSIRTHGWLSPSLGQQRDELKQAGFSDAETHAVLLYRQSISASSPATETKQNATELKAEAGSSPRAGTAAIIPSVLYGMTADECLKIDPNQYRDVDVYIASLRNRKGKYEKLAAALSKIGTTERSAVAEAFFEFSCQSSRND